MTEDSSAGPITFQPGRWYVMDRLAPTMQRAYVAGPFDTRTDAELERCQVNIAGDCDTWQAPDDRPRENDLHSTVTGYAPLPQRPSLVATTGPTSTPTHYVVVRRRDGSMISGYFNRRWEDRAYVEHVIAADTRTGHLYEAVEVSSSDLIAKTYTRATSCPTSGLPVHGPWEVGAHEDTDAIAGWQVHESYASAVQSAAVEARAMHRSSAPFLGVGLAPLASLPPHLIGPVSLIVGVALMILVGYRSTRHLRPEVISARMVLRTDLSTSAVDASTDRAFVDACDSYVCRSGESMPVRVVDVAGVV